MWRLYLELTILIVLAFAVGALLARMVVRLVVKHGPPVEPPDESVPDSDVREVTR